LQHVEEGTSYDERIPFDVRMVDEFRTTVMCCKRETRLENGKRLRKMRELRLPEDRDVKWCNTPSCFGVLLGIEEAGTRNAKVPRSRAVDRDVNSALAHAAGWFAGTLIDPRLA
jgi:hypothetical protein